MKIGIIGTGDMGRTLGLRWAHGGHEVLFGSRDPEKARAVAARAPGARAGDFEQAAAFGQVVLYTVRDVLPSRLLRAPQALAGKVVIDCNNRDLGDDRQPAAFRFDAGPPGPSPTQLLASDVPAARVVKAFGTVPHRVIELPRAVLAERRISVFLCGDDPGAKGQVKALVEELGFRAVDSGGLAQASLVDGVADFMRFQIGAMGLGRFATLSLQVLPGAGLGEGA